NSGSSRPYPERLTRPNGSRGSSVPSGATPRGPRPPGDLRPGGRSAVVSCPRPRRTALARPGPRDDVRRPTGSEAALLDLLGDELLHPLDVLLVLALEIAPEGLEGGVPVRVGDPLVVPPDRVEPLAQLVDQVMVVILDPPRLADVFDRLGLDCHDGPP